MYNIIDSMYCGCCSAPLPVSIIVLLGIVRGDRVIPRADHHAPSIVQEKMVLPILVTGMG